MPTIHMLHRAGQCADDLFSAEIANLGLTVRQYAILKCAAEAGEASQTDLVAASGIDRSTVADIVRRLVDRGILERERTKADARRYAVWLTASGRQLLANIEPIWQRCEARLVETIPRQDRAAFLRALEAIVETCGPIRSAQVNSPRLLKHEAVLPFLNHPNRI